MRFIVSCILGGVGGRHPAAFWYFDRMENPVGSHLIYYLGVQLYVLEQLQVINTF